MRLIWFMGLLRGRRAICPCLPAGRKRDLVTKGVRSMDTVSTETRGRTLVVTIERPQARNAVDGPTARQLYDAFKAFDAEEALDVAILQGRGGAFCAGADLKGVAEGRGNPVHRDGDLGPMGCTRLALGKPVIAAVEGHAVAGGLELACWADLRVAAEGAVFGV